MMEKDDGVDKRSQAWKNLVRIVPARTLEDYLSQQVCNTAQTMSFNGLSRLTKQTEVRAIQQI